MSKKIIIGILAVFAALIAVVVLIAPPGGGRTPEGYIELGTSYAEAKPKVLSMYPNARTNDNKTAVSHGAITVNIENYEGVAGQKAKINYIFDPSSQKLDMLTFYIDDPNSDYKSLQKLWKKAVSGQYGRPEIDCTLVSPSSGMELMTSIWDRGLTEVSLGTYTDTGVILNYTTRSSAKHTAEHKKELKQYMKYDWLARWFVKWS